MRERRRGALLAYTRPGLETARRCAGALPELDWELYVPARLAEEGVRPLASPAEEDYGRLFREKDVLVFAGAAGIAVRAVSPFLRDKRTDPAVLCTGEAGRFVIPLLSGHFGGANALAERLGKALGAVPVITTATESRGRFSPDRWAAEHDFAISDWAAAKKVAAALLEGEVPICRGLPVTGGPPPGTFWGDTGPLGIYLGRERAAPFDCTLRLVPRTLLLGLGCRRGTSAEALARVTAEALASANLDPLGIRGAASLDRKRDEPGLLAYCASMGWPIAFFTPAELRAVPGGDFFSGSDFVERVTGVDNVCERAAMAAGGTRLLVRKYAREGVTAAVAAEDREVCFDEQ